MIDLFLFRDLFSFGEKCFIITFKIFVWMICMVLSVLTLQVKLIGWFFGLVLGGNRK